MEGPREPPPEAALTEQDLQGMARLPGITPQALAEARAQLQAPPPPEDDFGVWDENWDTFMFFLSLAHQWTWSVVVYSQALQGGAAMTCSLRVRDGLPSNRVESAARLHGIPRARWREIYPDILAMERAALVRQAELHAERATE